jgi:hypothetical protein
MKYFKLITWYPNIVQIMWNDMVQYNFNFYKILKIIKKKFVVYLFFSTYIDYICLHKYTPISHFIKWNEIFLKIYIS